MTLAGWPDHLLSLAEWDALDEDVSRTFELVDGVLQMSPRPTIRHQVILMKLATQLNDQLAPLGLGCVPEVDVVLVDTYPPVVRAPDLCVVGSEILLSGPARLRPDQVILAVEIVSPGSVRTDRVSKLSDYAQAEIPHYWIVENTSLQAYRLVDTLYELVTHAESGVLRLADPAPVTIDLDALIG